MKTSLCAVITQSAVSLPEHHNIVYGVLIVEF